MDSHVILGKPTCEIGRLEEVCVILSMCLENVVAEKLLVDSSELSKVIRASRVGWMKLVGVQTCSNALMLFTRKQWDIRQ